MTDAHVSVSVLVRVCVQSLCNSEASCKGPALVEPGHDRPWCSGVQVQTFHCESSSLPALPVEAWQQLLTPAAPGHNTAALLLAEPHFSLVSSATVVDVCLQPARFMACMCWRLTVEARPQHVQAYPAEVCH